MEDIIYFFNNYGVWGWLCFGVALIILELFIPGTFVLWFGVGALATGVFIALLPAMELSMQFLIFTLCSAVSVFLGFFVYRRFFGRNKEKSDGIPVGAQKYIGRKFVALEDFKNGQGKIKVGDTVWLAQGEGIIQKEDTVQVIAVEGVILKVQKQK